MTFHYRTEDVATPWSIVGARGMWVIDRSSWLPLAVVVLALQGCGGSDGGVASMPVPPAPVANTTFANLVSSQTFSTDSATTAVSFNLTSKTAINGAASRPALTISYDAAARSYTVSAPGRSEAFAPGDLIASTDTTQSRFQKTDGGNHDYLTVALVPYTGTVANKYVQLAFWQRNSVTGSQQDTTFDTLTYGFATAASLIPRTGSASFATDVFGLATTPGAEPRRFQGGGRFDVDFQAGIFSTSTSLTETTLVTGMGVVGGGIELTGSGHLSSSDGSFSGDIIYGGSGLRIAGTLNGHFYGPAAQELGGAFSASNKDGSTVTGALTGQLTTANAPINLSLTKLVTPQLFSTQEALLTITSFDGTPGFQARTTTLISQLNDKTSGNFSYAPGISSLNGGDFTSTSLIAGPANFTSYQKTFADQTVKLDLYRPGSANTELALTYASFGRWSTSSKNGVVTEADRVFLAYGLETPGGLLTARTGTATYAGVVYGAGANQTTAATYDVSGSSRFNVDFSNQSLAGSLALTGAPTGGGAGVDFGSFDFAGKLASYTRQSTAAITQAGAAVGNLTSTFYGPGGEEIGGPFTISTPRGGSLGGTTIVGVTLAKRQ